MKRTHCRVCGMRSRKYPGWCHEHKPCPDCGIPIDRRHGRCCHCEPRHRYGFDPVATYRPEGTEAEIWARIQMESLIPDLLAGVPAADVLGRIKREVAA